MIFKEKVSKMQKNVSPWGKNPSCLKVTVSFEFARGQNTCKRNFFCQFSAKVLFASKWCSLFTKILESTNLCRFANAPIECNICCQLTPPEVYCHVLPQGEAAVVSFRAGAHEGVVAAHGRRGGLGLEKLERLKRKFTIWVKYGNLLHIITWYLLPGTAGSLWCPWSLCRRTCCHIRSNWGLFEIVRNIVRYSCSFRE